MYFVEAMIGQGVLGYVLKESANTELVPAFHAVAAGATYFRPELGLDL